jgi:hypothetical protein
MLCRLSKPGIQHEWNPIKLADIFSEVAPDLANQIEMSSRVAFVQSSEDRAVNTIKPNAQQLILALLRYKEVILRGFDQPSTEEQLLDMDRAISEMEFNPDTAEGQRAAFAQVRAIIERTAGKSIDATADLAAREQVRKRLGLPLFPDASNNKTQSVAVSAPILIESKKPRLLDVEVVAIYW